MDYLHTDKMHFRHIREKLGLLFPTATIFSCLVKDGKQGGKVRAEALGMQKEVSKIEGRIASPSSPHVTSLFRFASFAEYIREPFHRAENSSETCFKSYEANFAVKTN